MIVKHDFKIKRGIQSYLTMLPPEFGERLAKLQTGSHWIDMGAGESIALEQFQTAKPFDMAKIEALTGKCVETRGLYSRALYGRDLVDVATRINAKPAIERPHITAITYEMKRDSVPLLEKKIRVIQGRFLENIPVEELGKADLITDVFGVFAYSPHLDHVIRKYVHLLKDDGAAYIYYGTYIERPGYSILASGTTNAKGGFFPLGREIVLDTDREGWSGGSLPNSLIRTTSGKELSILEWMKTLKGIKVEALSRRTIQPRLLEYPRRTTMTYSIRISRVPGSDPVIPQLKLVESNEGKPPLRVFEELP